MSIPVSSNRGSGDGGEFKIQKFESMEIGGKKVEIDVKKGKIIIPGVGSYTVNYGGEPVGEQKHLRETVMGVVKKIIQKLGQDLDPHNLNMEIDKKKIVYQPKGSADTVEGRVKKLKSVFIGLLNLEKGKKLEDFEDDDDFGEDFEFENENKMSRKRNVDEYDLSDVSSEDDEENDSEEINLKKNKNTGPENIDFRVSHQNKDN